MTEEKRTESYKEILHRIQKMNPAQKVVLAQKGSQTERKILSRDSSVDVQLALIKSPKITEGEAEQMAALASTPEVVLKCIYSSSRWLKSQRVRLACLKNPRIPQSVTQKLLRGLSKQQLRIIMKNPVMPQSTREIAKRMIAKR